MRDVCLHVLQIANATELALDIDNSTGFRSVVGRLQHYVQAVLVVARGCQGAVGRLERVRDRVDQRPAIVVFQYIRVWIFLRQQRAYSRTSGSARADDGTEPQTG